MDDNKKDFGLENAEVENTYPPADADLGDSTFGAERVESEAAFNELVENPLDSEQDAAEASEGEGEQELLSETDTLEETDAPEAEEEMLLAKYAADCEQCATKVYFELEDLDEDGNLLCPNCQEIIEIDNDAIDYYLVNKSSKEDTEDGNYVVDCTACEAVVHFIQEDIDDEENIVCPQCGEKIHIETEVLDAYKQKDIEKSLKKKAFLKKFFASVAGVILALAVCVAVIWFFGNKSVVKIDGTSVPMNIYKTVYFVENANNYVSSGFNMEQKPSKQKYDGEDYETWDDFLKESTEKTLKIYYGIYNAGQKEGYQLTDDDKQQIEDTIKNVKSYADTQKLSFEDYFKSNYGLGLNEKQFREYLELSAYVNSYYKYVMLKDVTDEQLQKIYDDNPANYEVVTFRYYYVPIDDSTSKEEALEQVKTIAGAKDEKEFHKLVTSVVSEDRAATYKDDDSTLVKDMACSNIQDRPVAEVLTDATSKEGTVTYGVSDDDTYAEVALLLVPRHKDESLIKDAAINEVASKKGEDFINKVSEKAVLKASVGTILIKLEF